MYLYMCVCICTHMHTYIHITYRPEINLSEAVSHWWPATCQLKLGWLACELQESACLHLPSSGI